MKKMLVIAVAAGLAAPAAVMADTTLYGKLHAAAENTKTTVGGVSTTENTVNSRVSRFGIKGSTALDNGMEATYGLEYGINIDQVNSPSSRNTFVGLKGGFGEVRVGRHDTPAKLATSGMDTFADTVADQGAIITADNERVDNAVAYINKFGPVGFAAAHSTGILEAVETNSAFGDANTMLVNYSNGPWYAGLGHTAINGVRKNTNVGLQYKAEAGHKVGLIYEDVKYDGALVANATLNGGAAVGQAGAKDTNVLVSGAYKMGNVTLKAGYGEGKRKNDLAANNGKEKLTTVGADYSLGKNTSVYLLWNENKNPLRTAAGTNKATTTALGVVTEF